MGRINSSAPTERGRPAPYQKPVNSNKENDDLGWQYWHERFEIERKTPINFRALSRDPGQPHASGSGSNSKVKESAPKTPLVTSRFFKEPSPVIDDEALSPIVSDDGPEITDTASPILDLDVFEISPYQLKEEVRSSANKTSKNPAGESSHSPSSPLKLA